MRAVIISFFKSSNIGDCILSNCLLDMFSNAFVCNRVSYTLSPFDYTNVSNVQPIVLNRGAGLKSKVLSIFLKAKFFKAIELFYWNKKYVGINDEEKLNRLISQSDIVIIGGGNMIFDLEDDSLSAGRFKYYATLARKNQKPVIACCIGIGPFKRSSQLKSAICALNIADYVSFRDERSYRLFLSNNGKNGYISTDPAFLLPYKDTNEQKMFIVINVIDPTLFTKDMIIQENIKEAYTELTNTISNRCGDVILLTTDVRDFGFAEEIANTTKSNIYNINSIELLYKIYKNTRLVIGSRMHAMITAFTQRIPIIGLEWQDKVGALFDYLQIPEYCHSIHSIDVTKICSQAVSILENNTTQKREFIDKMVLSQIDILAKDIEVALRVASKTNDSPH